MRGCVVQYNPVSLPDSAPLHGGIAFLDRDGVLNIGSPEYINNPDEFESDFGLEMGRYEEDWYFAGTGNLDECNGTYDVNGDYGYYITDKYPFTPPCTFGVRDPSFSKKSPSLP